MAKTRAHARAWVSFWLSAHANLLFSGSPRVGALLVMATLVEPRFFLLGLIALISARLTARSLGIDANGYSPYGYNALLVGWGVASRYAFEGGSIAFTTALGGASVFVTAALSSALGRLALPVLSLPFLVIASLASGAAQYVPLAIATPSIDRWAMSLPPSIGASLESLGSILFLTRVPAGLLVLGALLLHSRIAATLAAAGCAVALTLAALTHAPLAHRLVIAASFNAILAAIATGGVWFIPSRASFRLAVGSAFLTVLLTLGLAGPMGRLGLQVMVLPFNLTVLLVLFAMRQRTGDVAPHASDLLSPTPEDSVQAFIARRAQRGLYGLRFHLPFRGAWTCTQGVDGAFTHKDIWRYAFDFEVHAGAEGSLCLAEGEHPEDYHCFRLPVVATAAGTVVAIENNVVDNSIGDINDKEPWGNRVTLHHGIGLYSTVAHLVRGSIAVGLGQVVGKGDVLGYCGNSGRSPRPHLHFQLQTGPSMFAPTLPCRFAHAVVRSPDDEEVRAEITPEEGMALRNVVPHAQIGSYFDFALGQTVARFAEKSKESLECEVDFLGRLRLRSREHGTTLLYERTDDAFATYEVSGPAPSALYLLRVALSRVPFEDNDAVVWRDRVPSKWTMGRLGRTLSEVVALLAAPRDIEMTYQRRWEGDRLVIDGTSDERRGGTPRVRTKAILRRGRPISVEVALRGRTRRVVEATLRSDDARSGAGFSPPDTTVRGLEGGA